MTDSTVLLSGATGFLGTALLPLLDRPPTAILRGGDFEARGRRVGADLPHELHALRGDITTPLWGIQEALPSLAGSCHVVVNLAAETSWSARWNRLLALNVHGALQGLEVAAALDVPLVHVSSLFAAYRVGGRVPQELVAESPVLSDYERSKCRAEGVLSARAREIGVRLLIVRVGALAADLERPARSRRSRTRTAPLSRLLQEMTPRWLPYAREARVDVTPRDLAARRLAEIIASPPNREVVHIGLGDAAPTAGALLHEARSVGPRRWTPVPTSAERLLAVSATADRFGSGARAAAMIGLRYLASSAIYEGEGIGRELSISTLLRSLGLGPSEEVEPRASGFYGDWL